MKRDEEKLRAQGVSDLATSVLSPKLGHDLTTSDRMSHLILIVSLYHCLIREEGRKSA